MPDFSISLFVCYCFSFFFVTYNFSVCIQMLQRIIGFWNMFIVKHLSKFCHFFHVKCKCIECMYSINFINAPTTNQSHLTICMLFKTIHQRYKTGQWDAKATIKWKIKIEKEMKTNYRNGFNHILCLSYNFVLQYTKPNETNMWNSKHILIRFSHKLHLLNWGNVKYYISYFAQYR